MRRRARFRDPQRHDHTTAGVCDDVEDMMVLSPRGRWTGKLLYWSQFYARYRCVVLLLSALLFVVSVVIYNLTSLLFLFCISNRGMRAPIYSHSNISAANDLTILLSTAILRDPSRHTTRFPAASRHHDAVDRRPQHRPRMPQPILPRCYLSSLSLSNPGSSGLSYT